MKLWILTISMMHGQVEYGYKFIQKSNCERIGKEYSKMIKNASYSCKLKTFLVDTKNK